MTLLAEMVRFQHISQLIHGGVSSRGTGGGENSVIGTGGGGFMVIEIRPGTGRSRSGAGSVGT